MRRITELTLIVILLDPAKKAARQKWPKDNWIGFGGGLYCEGGEACAELK
jgi:hypothetical protein